jgi:hypothetical protein
MKSIFSSIGMAPYLVSIRALAILLPRRERAEWLREWTSELWYVYRSSVNGSLREWFDLRSDFWTGHRSVAAFCCGAFDDARSLRQNHSTPLVSSVPKARSAMHCLSALAVVAALSAIGAFFIPGTRTSFEASPYKDMGSLVMVARTTQSESGQPSVSVKEYRSWITRSQHLFSDIALYRPTWEPIQLGSNRAPILSVAYTSPNLFSALGIAIPSEADVSQTMDGMPSMLLAESAWRSTFGADPQILGRVLKIGDRQARVAGILNDGMWRLPGKVDAWFIENDGDLSALPADARGFVVARLFPRGYFEPLGDRWVMTVPNALIDPDTHVLEAANYECVNLQSILGSQFSIFFFAVFLAILSLPATTSLPLGEYPSNNQDLPWILGIRRWGFLFGKITLALPIIFSLPLDIAYLLRKISWMQPEFIQLAASFCICLFALRWSLRDQRARCPVCLCKLSHPARVGEASRNFLAWNGTELICADGHGLLHVPELPTCWFDTQRWLYLDSSWSSLFVKSI